MPGLPKTYERIDEVRGLRIKQHIEEGTDGELHYTTEHYSLVGSKLVFRDEVDSDLETRRQEVEAWEYLGRKRQVWVKTKTSLDRQTQNRRKVIERYASDQPGARLLQKETEVKTRFGSNCRTTEHTVIDIDEEDVKWTSTHTLVTKWVDLGIRQERDIRRDTEIWYDRKDRVIDAPYECGRRRKKRHPERAVKRAVSAPAPAPASRRR